MHVLWYVKKEQYANIQYKTKIIRTPKFSNKFSVTFVKTWVELESLTFIAGLMIFFLLTFDFSI